MTALVPPGTPVAVQLVQIEDGAGGSDEFSPLSAIAGTGSGSAYDVSTVQVFVQEMASSATSVTRHRVTAVQLANQTRSILTTPSTLNGMNIAATLYPYDPSTAGPNKDIIRGTGGSLDVVNPIYSEGAVANDDGVRAGQDVRAFLYAQDVGTATQGVRLVASAAGALEVASTPIAPATIPTAADFLTIAATVSTLIAANTARRFAIIQNLDAVDSIRVGDASIGAAQGIILGPDESITLETQALISVFPVAGTPLVSRTEIVT